MDLSLQVVSLELARELKENGYPQDGLWDWYCQVGGIVCDTDKRGKWIIRPASERHQGFGLRFVTPTVAELGERLPEWYSSHRHHHNGYTCDNFKEERKPTVFIDANTEANARAKTWLYLKKNNLLERTK
jgi:hypothetical protein